MNVSVFAQATAAKLAAYAPIKELLRDLIVNRGTTAFYIGDKGYFYMHVVSALEELKQEFPQIVCYEVMTSESDPGQYCRAIYLEGMMKTEEHLREKKQIDWMLNRCDVAVIYMGGIKRYYKYVKKTADELGKETIIIQERAL